MKTLLPLLILGLLALSARGTEPDDQLPPALHGKSFKLIWHDEFDGDGLDESKWEPRPDGKRKGGWWSARAISLDGDRHPEIRKRRKDIRVITGRWHTEEGLETEVRSVSIVAGNDLAGYDPAEDEDICEYWKAEQRYWEAG